MKYSTRIAVAAVISILVNLAIWEIAAHVVLATPVQNAPPPVPPPLVFTLSPPPPPLEPEQEPEPEQEKPRQIIETVVESDEPVAETDLISDKNSKASDITDSEGDRAAPSTDESSEFDQQGAVPTEMTEPSEPSPPVVTAPSEETPEAAEPTPETVADAQEEPGEAEDVETTDIVEDPTVVQGTLAEDAAPPAEPMEKPESKPSEQPQQEQEPLPDPIVVAQADKPKLQFQEDVELSKSREDGGAEGKGFMSFEANRHEMGAYMLEVRRRVLRHWKAGLLLKYHGVRRTQAVIECSIRPTGELEYIRIKEPGPSYAFAVICQEAIRKAAPFPRFPFDVPEMYRNENLEITWNFSYL
jgi:outer membrane biosynthesis protein TonB